ncbi:hypothetical protein APT_01179 [Acetobacter pasteurianus NBRC 101655]|nr:hypothetical protein APT_01179 [Acetobacter pasteurianus NBRC 101655]CCT58190.1 hypothetical protein APA386B_67 [Acetobacter pasteurianus 386B]
MKYWLLHLLSLLYLAGWLGAVRAIFPQDKSKPAP